MPNDIFEDPNDEIDNEEIDDEPEEQITLNIRKPKGKGPKSHQPVENAAELPLFPNADKDTRNTVAFIRVIKETKPGSGIKGNIAASSDHMSIYNRWGNGVYTLEACNEENFILRRLNGVEISFDEGKTANGTPQQNGGDFATLLLKSQHVNHEKELSRLTDFAQKSNENEANRGREYTTMVRETAKASQDAMAAFYNASTLQQQSWFANMMQQQNQMFQQTIILLTKGHEMALASAKNNDPMAMVQLMIQGLQLGMNMGGDDDPDWIKGIREAGGMIENFALMAQQRGDSKPEQRVDVKAENRQQATAPTNNQPKQKIMSKEELLNTVRLKEILRKRGIDFETFLSQAATMYAEQVPSTESDEQSSNVTDESNKDSEENQE